MFKGDSSEELCSEKSIFRRFCSGIDPQDSILEILLGRLMQRLHEAVSASVER